MKISLLFCIVILIAAGVFGWKRHGHLVGVREVYAEAAEEAAALGLEPANPEAPGGRASRTRPGREASADKVAEAEALARDLIAFVKEMKALEKEGAREPGPEMQRRIMEMMERLMEMNPAQIRVILSGIKSSPDLDQETRRDIAGFSILMLAGDHPQAALTIFSESVDIEGLKERARHVVPAALGKWAENDPLGALDWVRANSAKQAGLITTEARAEILAGAARKDPALALSLIDDAGLKSDGEEGRSVTVKALVRGSRGEEGRNALLAALRADGKHAGLLKAAWTEWGQTLADEEGYEAGTAWLASAKPSESEIAAVADGLHSDHTKGDTGRWIDWMADKLPPERLAEKVGPWMNRWTSEDYKAAGEWINGAAAGPAKQAAVKSYAKTVAPYEPAAAAEWALTLPPGKERAELLRTIHGEWEKKDEAAAAEFARQQGIGE